MFGWTLTFTAVLALIFFTLLGLLWVRKLQFDAVHQNFLDLEDNFGGQVIRAGFAVRPRYSGNFKGQRVSITFTKEGRGRGRRYYITITMQAHSRVNFSIMATGWMQTPEAGSRSNRSMTPLKEGKYMLEVQKKRQLKKLDLKRLEEAIAVMDPFAYVLMANSGMLLERPSVNIVEDTRFGALSRLLEGMHRLKEMVEG
ncbi:MAG: hypothetical protein D6681_12730 [Calditrichaeota bacterium]|nr:MAG: hypothetical protein D6681_12730 [Calditrichota bacterium]